jgi:hypothetical protein
LGGRTDVLLSQYLIKREKIKTALEKSPSSTQDEEQVYNFLTAMKRWELTKAEKLQILNLRPKTPVELHIVGCPF